MPDVGCCAAGPRRPAIQCPRDGFCTVQTLELSARRSRLWVGMRDGMKGRRGRFADGIVTTCACRSRRPCPGRSLDSQTAAGGLRRIDDPASGLDHAVVLRLGRRRICTPVQPGARDQHFRAGHCRRDIRAGIERAALPMVLRGGLHLWPLDGHRHRCFVVGAYGTSGGAHGVADNRGCRRGGAADSLLLSVIVKPIELSQPQMRAYLGVDS